MMQRKPKTDFQPRTPTLRVDSLHARRQGENAVILPIVYELAETGRRRLQPDSAIVPIAWPLKLPSRRYDTTIIPVEVPNNEEDRKKKLALLKKKVESAKERVLKKRKLRQKGDQPDAVSDVADTTGATTNSTGKTRYFATAVQLLLLGVIALVVFAWTCFR